MYSNSRRISIKQHLEYPYTVHMQYPYTEILRVSQYSSAWSISVQCTITVGLSLYSNNWSICWGIPIQKHMEYPCTMYSNIRRTSIKQHLEYPYTVHMQYPYTVTLGVSQHSSAWSISVPCTVTVGLSLYSNDWSISFVIPIQKHLEYQCTVCSNSRSYTVNCWRISTQYLWEYAYSHTPSSPPIVKRIIHTAIFGLSLQAISGLIYEQHYSYIITRIIHKQLKQGLSLQQYCTQTIAKQPLTKKWAMSLFMLQCY